MSERVVSVSVRDIQRLLVLLSLVLVFVCLDVFLNDPGWLIGAAMSIAFSTGQAMAR